MPHGSYPFWRLGSTPAAADRTGNCCSGGRMAPGHCEARTPYASESPPPFPLSRARHPGECDPTHPPVARSPFKSPIAHNAAASNSVREQSIVFSAPADTRE